MSFITESGILIEQTPTITAGIYSTGDALGGKLTFEYAAKRANGEGRIVSITIVDQADQKAAIDLVLFDQDFTATADNAAIAILDADAVNIIQTITLLAADYVDTGANSVITKGNIQKRYKCKESWSDNNTGKKLYGQLIVRGTPTYAATDDITVKLEVEYD